MNEKIIYSTGHPSYIKLSAVLDDHGLMSDKEDELIQDILNILGVPEMVHPKTPYEHGIDTIGDENW